MKGPFRTINQTSIQPLSTDFRTDSVVLPGGVNYPAGTVLGYRTGTATNEVQTIAVTGNPTGGSFRLAALNTNGAQENTGLIPYNATAAQVQAAIEDIIGLGNCTVTGTAPTWTVTFGGEYGLVDVTLLTLGFNGLTGGTTPNVTVTETTKGHPGGGSAAAAYASTNTDGTQTAKCVLFADTRTDMAGRIINEYGVPGGRDRMVLTQGDILCSALVGLDAGAVAQLGKLVKGSAFNSPGAALRLT